MILYKDDFERYGAFPDVTTSNTSFLRMVKLFEKLGVDNRYFFLALHDRELVGVDPFKVDSPELMIRIAQEASRNVWYFLRELVRVPSTGGTGVSPLILNRFVVAFTWLTYNNMDTFSIILRQVGKSTILFTIDTHILHFYASHYDMAFMSKDIPAIQEAVERIKTIRDALPGGLLHLTRKDGDNKEGICYTGLDNQLKTFVAQPSVLGARKISRGLSLPYLQFDETNYFKNFEVTYSSALSTSDAAREQAARAGLISVVNLASTAGDPSTPEGRYGFKLKNTSADFHEKVYDTPNREATMELLRNASIREMWHLTYSYRQLGKTDEWLQRIRNRSDATEAEFARDYLSRWVSDTSKGGLSEQVVSRLMDNQIDATHTVIVNNIIFKWYESEAMLTDEGFLNQPLILGMDGSENVGKDFSSLFIINPKTLKTVMSAQTNTVNLTVFGKTIFDILVGFPRAVFIPERNHTGSMITDMVIDLMLSRKMNPYRRIYNTVVQDATHPKEIEEHDISGATKGRFGFRTSGGKRGSRSQLYGTVIDRYMELAAHLVHDKITVDQLSSLEYRNGRLDHPVDGNDDMVIASLLTVFLIFYGRNLSYYGISPDDLFKEERKIASEGDDTTPRLSAQEYESYLYELADLENRLSSTDSLLLRSGYERKITRIKEELDGVDFYDDYLSISQMMNEQAEQITRSTPTVDLNRLRNLLC